MTDKRCFNNCGRTARPGFLTCEACERSAAKARETPGTFAYALARLALVSLLAFLFWGIAPAGANNVPTDEVAIGCTGVDLSWHDFPTRPVDLTVTVTFDDQNSTNVVSTGGARDGKASVPLDFHGTGSASVLVEWTLRKDHSSGPVTADLTCDTPPTTTTTPTTPPRTPATYRMIPPATAGPPVECGPQTLACTGLNAGSAALFFGGWTILGLGVALLYGARVRRDEQ